MTTIFWQQKYFNIKFLIREGLPTLGSIISLISPQILKMLVSILLQISWLFQITPTFFNLDDSEGVYGNWNKNQHLCLEMVIPKWNNFPVISESTFKFSTNFCIYKKNLIFHLMIWPTFKHNLQIKNRCRQFYWTPCKIGLVQYN